MEEEEWHFGRCVCTSKAIIISSLTHNVAFLFFCISDCFVFSFTQDWCGDKPLFLLYHANACSRAGILSTSMHWDVALQRYDSQLPRLSYFPFDVLTALSFSLSQTQTLSSFSPTQVSNLVCCLPSQHFNVIMFQFRRYSNYSHLYNLWWMTTQNALVCTDQNNTKKI